MPGWKAKKTKIHNLEKDTSSFAVSKCPEYLGAEDMEEIRCNYCNKLLFKREKHKSNGFVTAKCLRCGKNNLIFSR